MASCLEDRVSARFQSATSSCVLSITSCCLLGPHSSLFQELHAQCKSKTLGAPSGTVCMSWLLIDGMQVLRAYWVHLLTLGQLTSL